MRHAVVSRLRCTAIIILMLTTPKLVEAADLTLLLAVQVNGYSIDKIGKCVSRDGALFARAGDLG